MRCINTASGDKQPVLLLLKSRYAPAAARAGVLINWQTQLHVMRCYAAHQQEVPCKRICVSCTYSFVGLPCVQRRHICATKHVVMASRLAKPPSHTTSSHVR